MPNIANRDAVLRALREELVGPCPLGQEIDCAQVIHLEDAETAYRPYRQIGSGEEILQRNSPTKRYGVGVLYPREAPAPSEELDAQLPTPGAETTLPPSGSAREPLTPSAMHDCDVIAARTANRLPETDSEDLDLSTANTYKPSSMAVSLLVSLPEGATLIATASGGRYRPITASLPRPRGREERQENREAGVAATPESYERTWWLRSPVRLEAIFTARISPLPTPTSSPRTSAREC